MGEIMLNKSFVGDWGTSSEANIPHEIINMFKSDNGKIYIYVPPYGGFDTKGHEIDHILITGNWSNNTTEVYYLASGLTLMHQGGLHPTEAEKVEQIKLIKSEKIKYGKRLLHEIKMAEVEEESVFYLTFKADHLVRPKKRLVLSWDGGHDQNTKDKNKISLPTGYKYQRQRGYIKPETVDYQIISGIIANKNYWESNDYPQIVSPRASQKTSEYNFLRFTHKEYDETSYTNLFYELFHDLPTLFNSFAKEVLGIDTDDDYCISSEVQTEDKHGRIDILALGKEHVIVIENKIKSGLNGIDKHNRLSQLTTYIEDIERKYSGMQKFYFLIEPEYNDIDISRFDQKRGNEFQKIKYSELHKFFKGHKKEIDNSRFGKYADDIISAIQTHTVKMRDVVEGRFLDAISHN